MGTASLFKFSNNSVIYFQVNNLPVNAYCRVKGCRQYGKITRRIDRHLQKAHDMSRKEHEKLPSTSYRYFVEDAKTKPSMKYRRPERCFVEGCQKHGEHFSSLTKHLKNSHSMNREQYQEHRFVIQCNLFVKEYFPFDMKCLPVTFIGY